MNDTKRVREAIKRAIAHLVKTERCTAREARRRIHQRARVARAGLGQVARYIIAKQATGYQYNVPI
jgi:AmiR/NasT family two-component response regulator